MGIAPLDNTVNTKGTKPGATSVPLCTRSRRLCASNTFFSGEHGYARSRPPRRHVPANTQGNLGEREVTVALAVAVGGGVTQTRVQTSGFCIRVGNLVVESEREREKGDGCGRLDAN